MYNPYDDNGIGRRGEADFGGNEEPTAEACYTCCGPMVLVDGVEECPKCDRVPSEKPAALFQAGEHPAFAGTWMGRVYDSFDEEPTKDLPAETMAQAVAR